MPVTINGSTGVTAPAFDGALDGADITTGDIASARIATALNASGSAPIYACRAWVNFNGTGTVAIRASGNVTSITDNGVGTYTVNFATAMPDANYAVVGFARRSSTAAPVYVGQSSAQTQTDSAVQITVAATAANIEDSDNVSVAIFR